MVSIKESAFSGEVQFTCSMRRCAEMVLMKRREGLKVMPTLRPATFRGLLVCVCVCVLHRERERERERESERERERERERETSTCEIMYIIYIIQNNII
jgi:hypothetical protein